MNDLTQTSDSQKRGKSPLHYSHPVFWLILCGAALSGTTLSLVFHGSSHSNEQMNDRSYSQFEPAFDLNKMDVPLVDTSGENVSLSQYSGTPTMVFFGFTHCPDVCPTTLAAMSDLIEESDDAQLPIRAAMITVDPQRDISSTLSAYLKYFDERIDGLSGTIEQIRHAATSLAAYYKKIPLEGDDYTMDHTASVYLFNRDGHFTGTISPGEPRETILSKVRRLRRN